MRQLNAWGAITRPLHNCIELTDRASVPQTLKNSPVGIVHGNGRSYGDIALNPGGTAWLTRGLNHLVQWNPATGILTCEAGVLLRDIQNTFLPQGWMLPVTPGTLLATVGGAIANDVHGKNHHHFGSFGDHLLKLWLVKTSGEMYECSHDSHANLFAATIGGLGLTGVITLAQIQLRPVVSPWLDTETQAFHSFDEFLSLSRQSESDWEHTVSWVDCLSGDTQRLKGIFMRANHSPLPDRNYVSVKPKSVPLTPPVSLFNTLTLRPLNFAYYSKNKLSQGARRKFYESYLYPLDAVSNWNRIYGPKGFYQYQNVIPTAVADVALKEIFKQINASGKGSFLSVLKKFGNRRSLGMLSFPRPGITFALDFPNTGQEVLRLFERLDRITIEAGGAVYPAKDERMSARTFHAGYSRIEEFMEYRDPKISSSLSRRLMGI